MFEEYTIKDVMDEIIDYRGKTPKKLGGDWSESKTKYMALSAKNIKKGRIVHRETIRYVDEDMYKKWMKQEVNKGTILITSEAPFGELLYWDLDDKIVLSQRLFGLKIKKEYNPKYIYYYMYTSSFQSELSGRATGSTVTGLRQPELLKCHLKVPSRKIQDKIADILTCIDKKIELNDMINNNLFELLKQEFREKFYNKEEKNSYLIDYISETIGGDWGRESPEGNNNTKVYCVRGTDIPSMEYGNKGNAPIRYILEKNYKNKKLDPNNIIIEISGGSSTQSTGRTAYITKSILDMYNSPLLCTNFCRAIEAKSDILAPFVYMNLKLMYEDDIFFNWENGTTGIKNLALNDMLSNVEVVIPDEDAMKEYYLLFNNVMNKISGNSNENIKLGQLKDTLLPKLMNGEIDLDKIDI